MLESYAILAETCPDEDIPLLRELLSFDALCRISCTFVRDELGGLHYAFAPSPLHWSRQSEWPWVIREANLEHHHRCLDVGGGWAVVKYAIARRCKELISLEPTQEVIDKTQTEIDHMGYSNIRQVIGDARDIPFPDDHFDRVFCISVIEHIPDGHRKAVRECCRVLKPGGILLLTMDVLVEGDPVDDFYLNRRTASEILTGLGVIETMNPNPGLVLGAELRGGEKIVVMMARCKKPEGGK